MSEKPAIVVHFPVSPHVYKYLQNKCGEKLEVTKNCLFGSIILDIMSKKYSDLLAVPDDYTYPVEISLGYLEKMGFYIDAKVLRKFNARVDKIFREEMRTIAQVNYDFNQIPKEKSLKQFLVFYNISEEEIKLETLIKDLRRKTPKAA